MSYSLYILKSKVSGRYYVGTTVDRESRLARHNGGKSLSTRAERPWEIVYIEEYSTRGEAMKREKQIKSWKSRKAIEKLITP